MKHDVQIIKKKYDVEIIKNAPPPPPPRISSKWPFSKMEPGDLVQFENEEIHGAARVAAHNYARAVASFKYKFVTRTIDGVLNIWCVEKT